MSATDVIPDDADLPGTGWLAIDDGFAGGPGGGGPGAVFDCVGPSFPDRAVVDTAASPHFVRPPGALVHGLGVAFDSIHAADTAAVILASLDFAACLGRSVAADLASADRASADLATGNSDAELLGVEVSPTDLGHRVRFTGGDVAGVRAVNLDIVVVRAGTAVGVLWCGDSGIPFPDGDLRHLAGRLRR